MKSHLSKKALNYLTIVSLVLFFIIRFIATRIACFGGSLDGAEIRCTAFDSTILGLKIAATLFGFVTIFLFSFRLPRTLQDFKKYVKSISGKLDLFVRVVIFLWLIVLIFRLFTVNY